MSMYNPWISVKYSRNTLRSIPIGGHTKNPTMAVNIIAVKQ